MKVLVTYAEAGSGHGMAARALYDAVAKLGPHAEVECVNILDRCRFPYRASYAWMYRFLVGRLPLVWSFFFWLFHVAVRLGPFRWLRRRLNAFQAAPFIRDVMEKKPDRVLATHFFPVDVVSGLKAKGHFKGELIAVITDYGVHRFWIDEEVDVFVVGSDGTRAELIQAGIPAERVRVLGIPVRAGFAKSREHAREPDGAGANPRGLRILVASGGMGIGPIEDVVRRLAEADFCVDVVCGHNHALHARLTRRVSEWGVTERVRIFGFVDTVHKLMREADLVISKPGGVTVSECIATATPLIVMSPIPGQEEMNARWLYREGLAKAVRNPKEIVSLVQDLGAHPEELDGVRNRMLEKGHPDAAREIARLTLLKGRYSGG